ncbi:MAG: cadherin-like beta sandwich domain-containing protein [Clostridia bacterium]|nr:cadherin-like beta sandwich domain-containing protein [Clostridia bacterium]
MRRSHRIIRSLLLIIAIAFLELSVNKVFAVDLSISANKSTIGKGETSTITISSQYTGRVNLTVSGGTISSSKLWLENGSGTITVTANSDNGVKVTATPVEMSDSSGKTVNVGAKSVSIAKKSKNNNNNNNQDQPKEKEPTFKSANEKMYATGNINVRKSYSADSDKLGSLQTGDEVTRTGVGDNGWSKVTFNGGVGYIKSSLLTTEQPKKSEDKSLKSLSVEGFEITPAFNPEVTEYSIIVGKDIEKVEVKAEANDEKSKVEIANVEKIEDGDNLIKIVVTAEDGTARTYSINAKKQEEKVVGLASLKIQGYTIEPKFTTDVYEYKLTILDPKVTNLEVITNANAENAKIEVTGNTNIKPGENIISIKVTSEDGKDTATYKIVVNKTAVVAGTTGQNNMILYGGIGIIALLVIAIIVVVVIAKRKSKYEEEEFEEDYEDLYGYSTKSEPSTVRESNFNSEAQNNKENIEEGLFGKLPDQNIKNDTHNRTMSDSDFNYNPYTSENLYEAINNNKEESVIGKYNVSSNESNDYPGKKFNYGETSLGYSFDNIDKNKQYNPYKDVTTDNVFGVTNNINDNIFGTTKTTGIDNDNAIDYNQHKKVDNYSNNNGDYFSGTSNFNNYYSNNTNNVDSNNNFYSNDDTSLSNKSDDWNYDDERKPRRSRGKHSK